ncbi:MAG: MATE family efflux transporter [Gammaproteobacteria bacterium]|nr:MATE family efflux transporter [Gammaproteobacteria bacterium]
MLNRDRLTRLRLEARTMLAIAFPTMLAQLAAMLVNVVDVIMAGHLSSQALAAISVGINLFNPIMVAAIGLFVALNPMVAHLNGEERHEDIAEVLRQGLWLAVLLALPAMLAMRYLGGLAVFIGVEPSVLPDVDGYLKALSWGQVPLFAFFALRFFNEGLFNTKPVMYIQFLAVPLNAFFNWVFMYGHFGVPAMGAVGLGYATSLVWSLIALALLAYTAWTPRYREHRLFGAWVRPHGRRMLEILRLGVPMAVSLGMEVLLFAVVGLLIGRMNVATIAGHQIAINLASLTFMIPLGLSMAITSRVGYFAGQGSLSGIRQAGVVGVSLSGLFMWASASLFILAPEFLVGFYTPDPAVQAAAAQLLFFAAIFQLSDGFQVSGQGALRGLKDTQVPMLTNTFAYWAVGFPIGWWMAEPQGWGAKGYWLGLVAGLSVAAVAHNGRFAWLCQQRAALVQKARV